MAPTWDVPVLFFITFLSFVFHLGFYVVCAERVLPGHHMISFNSVHAKGLDIRTSSFVLSIQVVLLSSQTIFTSQSVV